MTVDDSKYPDYNSVTESQKVFDALLSDPQLAIPPTIRAEARNVCIHGHGGAPTIPSPWRETEAITAVKALEACVALAIARDRYPDQLSQKASIDSDHATLSLFMSYLSTVNGYGKWDERSLPYLKPTDIHQAQSNLYRRLSANMYETKDPGKYYHTHGSLEATPILNALGLPGFLDPDIDDYDSLCEIVQKETQRFSADELDKLTTDLRQAGAIVFKADEFLKTEHGRELSKQPVIVVEKIEGTSPPTALLDTFAASANRDRKDRPYLLRGLRVLDLTRVIAGPSISRTLAEYGASVLKVTSPTLPDVPWYQVDLNFGKRTCELDLRNPHDRETFEKLLDEDGGVDVIVDGYRPGSLDRLGYGAESLKRRWGNRGKGFVYVQESCFGHVGPWKERSGWQPIADSVSGLAWGHGLAMGLDEPVLPPFPMSDYGTGGLGAVGALLAIHRRAVEGGSYVVNVSLTGWNLWAQSLGQYPDTVWAHMLREHNAEIEEFRIGHLSNFDVVSKAAIKIMKRLSPRLFDDKYLFSMQCPAFRGVVKSMRPVVQYDGMRTGFELGKESRPNGFDTPSWEQ